MTKPILLSTRDVAAKLGVVPADIRYLINTGKIEPSEARGGRGHGGGFLWSHAEILNIQKALKEKSKK